MNDLMIDIETLGNGDDAAVVSIGACFFDPVTGKIGETFHVKADIVSVPPVGLDPSTVKWWLQQSKEAQDKLTSGTVLFEDMLSAFIRFIDKNSTCFKVKPWGNGATFDITLLQSAFRGVNSVIPWRFWNVRDVRTIVDLGTRIGVDVKKVEFDGVPHDALDDAKHQVKYVSLIIGKLLNNEK